MSKKNKQKAEALDSTDYSNETPLERGIRKDKEKRAKYIDGDTGSGLLPEFREKRS